MTNMPTLAAPRRNRRFQRATEPPPHQLTGRDEQIILAIGDNRFLTSQQIQTLIGGSEQNILRSLQRLYHAGYLDRPRAQLEHYTAGSAHMVYALADKGARLVIERRNANLADEEWKRKNREVGRPFMRHTLAVAATHVALVAATRARPEIELIDAKTLIGQFPKPPVSADKAFAWQTTLRRNDATHKVTVNPDYAFALRSPTIGHRAYLVECDRGTMPIVRSDFRQTSIARKFSAYINGHAANLHQLNFGWKAFRILFITNTAERARNMREALNNLTKATNVRRLFYFTTADALSSADLFSHTWIDGNGQAVTLI